MVSKNTKTLVLFAGMLLACVVSTSGAGRHLEEEHPGMPEHELPPLPKVELPPKPELPPFPDVHHLPSFPEVELPKVELPPKPEMPGIPEFHVPEPEAKP